MQVGVPARAWRLRAPHEDVQPQLAGEPGLRWAACLRPGRVHLAGGHRHWPPWRWDWGKNRGGRGWGGGEEEALWTVTATGEPDRHTDSCRWVVGQPPILLGRIGGGGEGLVSWLLEKSAFSTGISGAKEHHVPIKRDGRYCLDRWH